MKIVKVIGGLGNQMFQYAFYRSLKEIYKEVKIDISSFDNYNRHNGYELDKVFNIKPDIASVQDVKKLSSPYKDSFVYKLKNRIFGGKNTEYIEKSVSFKPEVFLIKKDMYFIGYWQSYKYFKKIEDIIREEFNFFSKLNCKNLKIREEIINKNSVGIHIRRGDYVTNFKAAKLHGGICNLDYYKNAVNYLRSRIKNLKFFVFSDDIIWCKKNLTLSNNTGYIDWNHGENSYIDMQLMSLCKHNIIANSTFSWWAAWLNENSNKIIICPKKWFNKKDIQDLLPNEWVKV